MVRTQDTSTPLLAAGALDRYVLQSLRMFSPLLRLDMFPLKCRGKRRSPSPNRDAPRTWGLPSELDNQIANDPS